MDTTATRPVSTHGQVCSTLSARPACLTQCHDDATLTAALAAVERDDSGDQVDEMYAIGRATD